MSPLRQRARGFTMIELVVSIVIAAIVAGFVAMMIGTPVQAYLATSRRADLSDGAESAMRSIDDEVRRALPNSVRAASIGNLRILELIRVSTALSYREIWPERTAMQFNTPIGQFSVLEPAAFAAGQHLVIDNRRTAGRSAYSLTNVITPATTTIATSTTALGTDITLSPPFRFPSYMNRSANQRAYIVPALGVIRYECDLGAGVLRRYDQLPIVNSIQILTAPSTTVASDITACRFQVRPGNVEHGGVAIVEITVSRAASGSGTERLRMVRQIRVENSS
jgi:MSHA biogenesis protein MshO